MSRPVLSPGKYLLGRTALDLRTFTVEELAGFTRVPVNTVYGFLHHLGSGITKEALPSDSPGRPRTRYSLTREGVEQLLEENLRMAGLLRDMGLPAGLDMQAQSAQAAVPASPPARAVQVEPVSAAAAFTGAFAAPVRAAAAFAAGAHEAAAHVLGAPEVAALAVGVPIEGAPEGGVTPEASAVSAFAAGASAVAAYVAATAPAGAASGSKAERLTVKRAD